MDFLTLFAASAGNSTCGGICADWDLVPESSSFNWPYLFLILGVGVACIVFTFFVIRAIFVIVAKRKR